MQREFFNLENLILGGLFVILLVYSGFMMSCKPLDNFSVDTFSTVDNSDDDDGEEVAVADTRRNSRRDRRACDDRDSCKDSCDYMFRNSRSKSECYDLDFGEVSDLEYVFDELHASSINKRSLEDIDVDHFEDFLEIDIDGWLDIIIGEEGIDHDNHPAYDIGDARAALEWIAENEPVARAIERVDQYHDILYHLFLRLGVNNQRTKQFALDTRNEGRVNISWSANSVQFNNKSLPLRGVEVLKFTQSFIGSESNLKFSGDSFMSYAERENNEQAVDLAHESLVRFCEDGTDDEFPDEDVKQCMLAVYCSIYEEENSDNIFEDALSGDADEDDCELLVSDDPDADDRLERLF